MIITLFLGLRSGHGVSHFEKGHTFGIINPLLKLRGFCRLCVAAIVYPASEQEGTCNGE